MILVKVKPQKKRRHHIFYESEYFYTYLMKTKFLLKQFNKENQATFQNHKTFAILSDIFSAPIQHLFNFE